MRRLIALTAAVALALPLVLGLGAAPARAEGNTVANVALGLAAFSVFSQLFAPPVILPAPVIVRPAPIYRQVPMYREVPVYREVLVYREVPVYRPVPMHPGWHGYGKVHPPVYRQGRPDRGHHHR